MFLISFHFHKPLTGAKHLCGEFFSKTTCHPTSTANQRCFEYRHLLVPWKSLFKPKIEQSAQRRDYSCVCITACVLGHQGRIDVLALFCQKRKQGKAEAEGA